MRLLIARHLWGVSEANATFFPKAKALGYDAIETPITWSTPEQHAELRQTASANGLDLILMTFTGADGGDGTVESHLASFRRQAETAIKLKPLFINCHSGRDAWSAAESLRFYREIVQIEKDLPCPVAHETHRGRVFFNPWITRDIVSQVPALKLTADFSHWVCVAERLIDDEKDCISLVAEHCLHIHARVGYSEGPQVADPRAPEYAGDVAAHERWWDECWESMAKRGLATAHLTPEFGPPGYMHTLPFTNVPVSDLAAICDWQSKRQAERFAKRYGSASVAGAMTASAG